MANIVSIFMIFYVLNDEIFSLMNVYGDGIEYPTMTCGWTGYSHEFDEINIVDKQKFVFAGQQSYHNDDKEDRRYNWKYCTIYDAWKNYGIKNIQIGSDVALSATRLDMEFRRGCGGNTALNYVKSTHYNGNEDRVFEFKCSALDNKLRLAECGWTSSYVADYDNDIYYECPNNGIIRSVATIHDNTKDDRKWEFECCRVSISDKSNELSSMNCIEDANYVNDFDGPFDITKSAYFFNGINSIYNNGRKDRRFKFRYCKQEENEHGYHGTNTLTTTEYDGEWERSCSEFNGGHSGIVGIKSEHNNGKEDRSYTIKCGNLDTTRYGLAKCGWTGDLNNFDNDATFNCLENGIIRSIWSKHNNNNEDRIFRLECCNIVSNKFSDIVGTWQNVLSCNGCDLMQYEVSIGVSKEHSETTSDEYREELGQSITTGYTWTAPSVTGGGGGFVEVSISGTQAQTTANSLTSSLVENTLVTQRMQCRKTYFFQWVQSANDYIENVGNNNVNVFSNHFLCTNNPYPSCPLGFCDGDDCDQCL